MRSVDGEAMISEPVPLTGSDVAACLAYPPAPGGRDQPTSDCVNWTGAVNNCGYGVAHVGTTTTSAHRLAWIKANGPIADDLAIDHLCRNRLCVNVDHLEPVTALENLRRAIGPIKTHCPHGHALEGDNLYIQRVRGYLARSCRTCRNERSRGRS